MLLEASVAVHVTVVVPTGNCDPAGGLHTTVGVPQSSVAVGVVKLTGAVVANGHGAGEAEMDDLESSLSGAAYG